MASLAQVLAACAGEPFGGPVVLIRRACAERTGIRRRSLPLPSRPGCPAISSVAAADCAPVPSSLPRQSRAMTRIGTMSQDATTCRLLAPEDVSVGDYVTQMESVCEIPSFYWACDVALPSPEQPVRFVHTPQESGTPARVRSVCLPFVYVKLATGCSATWDLRQCRIARMASAHARVIWKELKPQRRQYRQLRQQQRRSLRKRRRRK